MELYAMVVVRRLEASFTPQDKPPLAIAMIAIPSELTSRDSIHHWQSVSAGKTTAIPTELSGHLACARDLLAIISGDKPEAWEQWLALLDHM